MRDNPEGGDLIPAKGVRRRCKKEFFRFILAFSLLVNLPFIKRKNF